MRLGVGLVLLLALLAAALLPACGGDGDEVTAVVVEVDGDLTSVDRFVVRLPDGTDQPLVPAPGIRFHGDASITHVRDHLRSGEPVVIVYEVLDDGTWVALEVRDAGA